MSSNLLKLAKVLEKKIAIANSEGYGLIKNIYKAIKTLNDVVVKDNKPQLSQLSQGLLTIATQLINKAFKTGVLSDEVYNLIDIAIPNIEQIQANANPYAVGGPIDMLNGAIEAWRANPNYPIGTQIPAAQQTNQEQSMKVMPKAPAGNASTLPRKIPPDLAYKANIVKNEIEPLKQVNPLTYNYILNALQTGYANPELNDQFMYFISPAGKAYIQEQINTSPIESKREVQKQIVDLPSLL